jgi:hypothetical protein
VQKCGIFAQPLDMAHHLGRVYGLFFLRLASGGEMISDQITAVFIFGRVLGALCAGSACRLTGSISL